MIERGLAWRYVVVSLLISAGLAAWTVVRLHPRMLDRSRSSGAVTDERAAGTQAYRRVMYLWFFDPQRRGDAIGVHWAGIAVSAAVTAVAGWGAWVLWGSQAGADGGGEAVGAGGGAGGAGGGGGGRGLESGEPGGLVVGGFDLMGQAGAVLLAGVAAVGALVLLTTVAGANPVAVKEQRTRKLGRGNWMARLFGATLIGSLLLMLAATGSSTARMAGGAGSLESVSRLGGVIAVLQVGLVLLLTPALASGLISTERESRGWQLLQVTPMSAVSIVVGKLLSVVVPLALVLMATLPAYAVLVYVRPSMAGEVQSVLVTLGMSAVMCLLVSSAWSAVVSRTSAATVGAYLTLLTFGVGTFLLWAGEGAPIPTGVVRVGLMLNPLAACLGAMGTLGFESYDLLPAAWWAMAVVSLVSLVVLVVSVWRLTRPR